MVVNRATEVYICICLRICVIGICFIAFHFLGLLPHPLPPPRPLLLCIAFRRLDSRFTHPLTPRKEHVPEQTAG